MPDTRYSGLTDGSPAVATDEFAVSRTAGAASRRVTVDSVRGSIRTNTGAAPPTSGTWGPVRMQTDGLRGLWVDVPTAGWVPTNRPCNVQMFGAKSDGVTNDAAAIAAAFTAGCMTVFLPKNTIYGGSAVPPANTKIIGEDSTAIIDRTGSTFNVGGGCVVENITIKDTNEPSGSFVPLFINRTPSTASVSPVNHLGLMVWKGGYAGDSNTGITCTHSGIGGGDNFYAQTDSTATQFDQALFRGDLFATAASGALVFYAKLISTAQAGSRAVQIDDGRTAGDTSGVVFLQTATRTGSNPLLVIRQSGVSFGGPMVQLDGAFGSGTYTGDFIRATQNGSPKFTVDSQGNVGLNTTPVVGRQLALKGVVAGSGVQLINSGATKAWAITIDGSGHLVLGSDSGSGGILQLLDSGGVKLFNSAGACITPNFGTGVWGVCP